jgi:ribonuclease Y
LCPRESKRPREKDCDLIEDAKRRADTLLKEARLEAKDKLFKMKSEFDTETRETRAELKKKEKWLHPERGEY